MNKIKSPLRKKTFEKSLLFFFIPTEFKIILICYSQKLDDTATTKKSPLYHRKFSKVNNNVYISSTSEKLKIAFSYYG